MSDDDPRQIPDGPDGLPPRSAGRHGDQPLDTGPVQSHGPTRPGRPDEVALASIEPDAFARLTLTLLRLNFQTFADPPSQGWLKALQAATTAVGPRAAGPLCYDLVALVQVLRNSRRSTLGFNQDACPCCRVWLTPEERRLMELLGALRQGQTGRARTIVQMLCDGVPSENLVAMADLYLRRHAPEFQRSKAGGPGGLSPASQAPPGHDPAECEGPRP